jgi:hypothetical protein
MIDWKELQSRLPKIVDALGNTMGNDAIGMLISLNDEVIMAPSVSIAFAMPDGTRLKVSLAIEFDDRPLADDLDDHVERGFGA